MLPGFTVQECEDRAAMCVLRILDFQRRGLLVHRDKNKFATQIDKLQSVLWFWTYGAERGGYKPVGA